MKSTGRTLLRLWVANFHGSYTDIPLPKILRGRNGIPNRAPACVSAFHAAADKEHYR